MSLSARHLVALATIAAIVAACAGALASTPPPSGLSAPTVAGPAPVSPEVGIVISVDSSGLDQVHGFTLRDQNGRQIAFTLGQLQDPTQFPPGHLVEHQLTAEPVKVWFTRGSDGKLVVYRLTDAAASASPSPSDAASP